MDADQFNERAAIMEFDGGLSRFRAETMAAREQGIERWEALGHVAGRVVEQARDHRDEVAERAGQNDVPAMQRGAQEEARPLPQRDGDG